MREPNFRLSLSSSHAHLLPPACTPSPQSWEGRNKQQTVLQPPLERGCPGNPRPGVTVPPSFTLPLTLAAPPQLIILVLGKTRGRMPTTHSRRWKPKLRTNRKVCSFSERLSCISPSASPAPPAPLPGSANPPCRNRQAARRTADFSHTSAGRSQLQKTAASSRIRLFLRRGDGELCWRSRTEAVL